MFSHLLPIIRCLCLGWTTLSTNDFGAYWCQSGRVVLWWKMAKMKSGLATCASTRAAPEWMPHWARRSQLLQPFSRGQNAFAYFSWLLGASFFKAMQVSVKGILQHKKILSPPKSHIFLMVLGFCIALFSRRGIKNLTWKCWSQNLTLGVSRRRAPGTSRGGDMGPRELSRLLMWGGDQKIEANNKKLLPKTSFTTPYYYPNYEIYTKENILVEDPF